MIHGLRGFCEAVRWSATTVDVLDRLGEANSGDRLLDLASTVRRDSGLSRALRADLS